MASAMTTLKLTPHELQAVDLALRLLIHQMAVLAGRKLPEIRMAPFDADAAASMRTAQRIVTEIGFKRGGIE